MTTVRRFQVSVAGTGCSMTNHIHRERSEMANGMTITRERAGSLKPAPLKTSATSSRPIVAHPPHDAALSRLTANPQSRAWRQLPAIDRFQASVVIGPVPEHAPDLGPCLLWLGAPTTKGYGVLSDAGKKWFAHRWSYAHFIGPIAPGFQVSHLCHTPLCTNAEGGHLIAEPGTQNIARTVRLNRLLRSKPQLSQTEPEYPCVEGHNDWIEFASKRWTCRTCQTAMRRIRRGVKVDPWAPVSRGHDGACANGHKWTRESTYLKPTGGRVCRTCNRLAKRRAKNGGVDRTDLPLGPYTAGTATVCAHGHEWTQANTYINPNGSRVCRICTADSARRYKASRRAAA